MGPKSSTPYTIYYHPQTMTGLPPLKPEIHQARLFLPLSNGSALIYNLCGKSVSPKSSGELEKQMDTHKDELIFLKIFNWLEQTQRFNVRWKIKESDSSPEAMGLIIKGATVVDLDPQANMDYKLSVRALKVGTFDLQVEYVNTEINEFLSFSVKLLVERNSPIAQISMSSNVHSKTTTHAFIDNILREPVHIPKSAIRVQDTQDIFFELFNDIEIQPMSEYALEIFYRPLKVKKNHQAKLVVDSPQLGVLEYELDLSSSMDNDKKSLRFESRLGEQACRKFEFVNFAQKEVTFNIQIVKLNENLKETSKTPDFTVESAVFQAKGNKEDPAGTKNVIPIFYEPSLVGVSKGLLKMSSPDGGDYEILLVGKGQNPTPKGPFNISSKGSTMLEFKNPFFLAKEYSLEFQNPCFSSSIKGMLKIDPRKSILFIFFVCFLCFVNFSVQHPDFLQAGPQE